MRFDEAILKEIRTIRDLLEKLEKLMSAPSVLIDPTNQHLDPDDPYRADKQRPFGDRGIDAPVGTVLKHLRTTPLPDEWAYCSGGLAPKDMHELLNSDRLPDTTAEDHGSHFVHIIKVSHG
jgi:hypothetical protein